MRVLFCGTHPYSTNGYSYVTIELAKEIAKRKDVKYSVFGFQNFGNTSEDHKNARKWPTNVFVYDAFANENPRQMGFGFDQIADFVTLNKPDVVVIYNDAIVVTNILEKLKTIKDRKFKIIVYFDQVYLHQKKEHIKKINDEADLVLAFTPYWEENMKKIGVSKPTDYLCHGFDKMVHYPVPKRLARQYFGLRPDDFIVMNLNRNQPRKRWDTCLQAWAEIVSRHIEEPIKLLIATAVNGAWNLIEVYERELGKRGLTLEQGMKHIVLIDNPQQLSDEEINILYNVADVGINTCDGEGFGLCNFQQAAIGIPQIIPYLGGFKQFFTKDNSLLVEPKFSFYVDASRDGVGGEALLCDWQDFADAIDLYYSDDDLRKSHGEICRRTFPEEYSWDKIEDRYYRILKRVLGEDIIEEIDANTTNDSKINLDDLLELEDNVDITELKKTPVDPVEKEKQPVLAVTPLVAPTTIKSQAELEKEEKEKARKKKKSHGHDSREDIKNRLRAKLESRKQDKKELAELRKKIDLLLANAN